jgi:ADP-ribosylglycohydrolase
MIPDDYLERVYAGVLGKMIGVYLGRPFEGWTYERISAELGEINGYVHEQLGKPLIVTDDDLTGTFTFLRALTDNGYSPDIKPEQIGHSWLNYIIEERTILWWGGMGHSTEHTTYLRLKSGILAPTSGSIELNGRTVAEQIGAQIFIDGWGMVAPGDPEKAAALARRAASVSHDGEGIYGAQVIAAMAALAFVEPKLNVLLDTAVSLIPATSVIFRLISDVREWNAREADWRVARSKLAARYGYDSYAGSCHIIPNHALIILSLLYGNDDLRRSLTIVNTSGWDTDCNSGNVGCLLGIKNGLSGIEAISDLRNPLDDRLYLPSADGGRAITDAVRETYEVVNSGRALQNYPQLAPKDGARFHFSLPGSVQGFRSKTPNIAVSNEEIGTQRYLALEYDLEANQPELVGTDTFIPPEAIEMSGYELLASPTLYPGQTLSAQMLADRANVHSVSIRLYLHHYGANDELQCVVGPEYRLDPGDSVELKWQIDELGGEPIADVGVKLQSENAGGGKVYLDYLTWEGDPKVIWQRPSHNGMMWRRAWVDAVDHYYTESGELFRLAQDEGMGMLMQGTRQWKNISVESTISPFLAKRFGLAVRVQGLKRYYAMLFDKPDRVQLVRVINEEIILAEGNVDWDGESPVSIALQVMDNELQGFVNGKRVFDFVDLDTELTGGGIALIVEEGCISANAVQVQPIETIEACNPTPRM